MRALDVTETCPPKAEFDVKDVCFPNGGGLITEADARLLQYCARQAEATAILEIGTKRGASAIVLCKELAKHDGHLYCIDPAFHSKLHEQLALHGVEHQITRITGLSPWVGHEVVPAVLDMLWIDGDHSSLGALGDFIFWEPRVRAGGIIAFHDYSSRYAQGISRGSVEAAVDLILNERPDLVEIGFVAKGDGGAIAFQKLAEGRT